MSGSDQPGFDVLRLAKDSVAASVQRAEPAVLGKTRAGGGCRNRSPRRVECIWRTGGSRSGSAPWVGPDYKRSK